MAHRVLFCSPASIVIDFVVSLFFLFAQLFSLTFFSYSAASSFFPITSRISNGANVNKIKLKPRIFFLTSELNCSRRVNKCKHFVVSREIDRELMTVGISDLLPSMAQDKEKKTSCAIYSVRHASIEANRRFSFALTHPSIGATTIEMKITKKFRFASTRAHHSAEGIENIEFPWMINSIVFIVVSLFWRGPIAYLVTFPLFTKLKSWRRKKAKQMEKGNKMLQFFITQSAITITQRYTKSDHRWGSAVLREDTSLCWLPKGIETK